MCSVCKWHYMCVCVSCSIVLILVKVVVEYCQCADDLPMLVIEVMSKLIDTLKVLQVVVTTPLVMLLYTIDACMIVCVYTCISPVVMCAVFCFPGCAAAVVQFVNSRMCQLVLGAGAVEAVGLKTITARHLGEGVRG